MDSPSASRYRALLVSTLAAILLCCGLSTSAAGQRCERIPLELDNKWIHSIASYGDSVLAVEPAEHRILSIGPHGEEEFSFTGIDRGDDSEPFLPSRLQVVWSHDHLLVGDRPGVIMDVKPGPPTINYKGVPKERDLNLLKNPTPLTGQTGTRGTLTGIYDWAVTKDDHLIAFADFIYPNREYGSGFVWLNRRDPDSFQILRSVGTDSSWDDPNETTFYFMLHPYVTTLGSKGYFLSMEEQPTIYEYDPKRREGPNLKAFSAFPRHVRHRPNLPPKEDSPTAPALFGAIATSTSPIGLYSWKNYIWLLGRQPYEGKTRWTVSRIDPGGETRAPRVDYTLYLPTAAEHLAVAPGNKFWSILEKSDVKVHGRQDVNAMLRLPSEWMLDSTSPLRRPTGSDICSRAVRIKEQ